MKSDPTIDAIREVRHQISALVGHDPRKLVEHYRQLQARHHDRIVSRNTEPSVGCGEVRTASIEKDALPTSAHPAS